jgi:diguanylate cyclase (GGDEF)-like protein/PAS domain S-box-containing protein
MDLPMDRRPALERTNRISGEDLQRFRLAMDHSGDIIVLIDRESMRFVDVNATACRLLGYSREELLAMGPQDVLPVPRPALERSYDELIRQPALAGSMNSFYLCRDGSRLPFESTRHVLRSGDNWLIAAISRDIRERLAAEQALRGSEGRFRALTELSSDLFWEQDAEYRFTAVSGSASQGLRRRLESQIGKRRWDTATFNMDEAAWAAHRADLDARREFRDLEFGRFDPSGERFWVSISGAPVFDADGAFAGYHGVGKDITARKREERLRELEQRTARVLAEAASTEHAVREVMRIVCESENWECARYFELDEPAGRMRFRDAWSSDAGTLRAFVDASRTSSFAPGEGLVGDVWKRSEALWVEDASRDPRVAAQSFARRVGLHAALVLPLSFDGRVIGVLSVSSRRVARPDELLLGALRLVGGQLGQYLMRKKAELALAESEARMRRTFELAATGIAHIGLDGRFLKVNRRLCEMLGYTEVELLGVKAEDVTHPEDRGVSAPGLARLRAGELGSTRFEKRYVRRDGSTVWAHVNVALVRGAGDIPEYEIGVIEDISERKENEARQLRRDQELSRFRTALDASADMVFLIDLRDLKFIDFNETACFGLGYLREELLGRDSRLVLAGMSTEELRASHAPLLARPERSDLVVRTLRRKDGSVFESEVLRHVVDSPEGAILVVNVRDLTERRRSEERQVAHLRYQEAIARFAQSALGYREATELVDDAVRSAREALNADAVTYHEGIDGERVLRGAAGAAPVAGVEHGHSAVPVRGDGGVQGELCAWSADLNAFGPEETKFLAAAAGVLSAGLSRIQSEGRLAFLAQFDVLTGLPNRALLSDRFSQLIVQARRHASTLGVLFIDLDDFKLVNDSLGHAGGDELLRETARRLQSAVRPGDTVARISGDEFAVILGDLARPDDAALVAQKIIDRVVSPMPVAGQEVFVTASIGIAAFPADGEDAETLLGAADAAMYRAKQSGRNGYQFFTADINQRTRARAQLGSELRRALERDEFVVYYQPKYDLKSRKPCGVEALLRWQSPERGMILPAEFIPVLEETGLIVQVGEWVLKQACADFKAWQDQGVPRISMAVNLSARQFRQHDLHARILGIVRAANVDPSLIELEMTESQLMHDPAHAIAALRALGDAGIRIALDDFGTGYSSLAYLTRFPVSCLKIDRSFVADLLVDEADAAIVRTIVDMAKTLGFTTVAEGVEEEAQASFLRGLGCEQAQGYLFARPMPAAALAELLLGRRPRRKPDIKLAK